MKQTYHTVTGSENKADFISESEEKKQDKSMEKPEWKVFFDGSFWGHHGRDRAGTERSVQKKFLWGGYFWTIPSIYVCGRGLVMDFCMRAEAAQIRMFMKKWGLDMRNGEDREFSEEQRMMLERDNPLHMEFGASVQLNGKKLQAVHGCRTVYFPDLAKQDRGAEGKKAAEYYGLNPDDGWMISRFCYPWPTKHRPEIRTLDVTMIQKKVPFPGPHFVTDCPGDTFSFIWPEGGSEHVLTVQEHEAQFMDMSRLAEQGTEYPGHCIVMSYTVDPGLPDGVMTLSDCADGDRPRRMPSVTEGKKSTSGAAAIGIIGGADGPTAISGGQGGQKNLHTVFSALHFEPVSRVEWRMIFHEKKCDDITVSLIPKRQAEMAPALIRYRERT